MLTGSRFGPISLNQQAGAFFEAYMAKARARMSISYNDNVIQRLIQRRV